MRSRAALLVLASVAVLALQGCAYASPRPGWRCWEESRGLLTCERTAQEPPGGWGCGAGDAGPWTPETCECGP